MQATGHFLRRPLDLGATELCRELTVEEHTTIVLRQDSDEALNRVLKPDVVGEGTDETPAGDHLCGLGTSIGAIPAEDVDAPQACVIIPTTPSPAAKMHR